MSAGTRSTDSFNFHVKSKEAAPGFYVPLSKADIGRRIPMDDIIALKEPKAIIKKIKKWAFQFPEHTSELTTIMIGKLPCMWVAVLLVVGASYTDLEFWQAAERGDEAYIDKGIASSSVNINWKNTANYGRTPLMIALEKNRVGVITSLLNAGADFTVSSDSKNTPLLYAAYHGLPEIVNKLIALGSYVDAQDKYGQTSLYKAAWKGHLSSAQALLDAHADVNLARNNGNTPLHVAAKYNKTEIALLLLQHSADKRAKGEDGKTPLDIAGEKKYYKLARLIEAFEPTSKPTTVTIEPTTTPTTVNPTNKLTTVNPTIKPASSNASLYWYIIIIICIISTAIITAAITYTIIRCRAGPREPQVEERVNYVNEDNRESLHIYEVPNAQ